MKKVLSILMALGLVATSTTSVVACRNPLEWLEEGYEYKIKEGVKPNDVVKELINQISVDDVKNAIDLDKGIVNKTIDNSMTPAKWSDWTFRNMYDYDTHAIAGYIGTNATFKFKELLDNYPEIVGTYITVQSIKTKCLSIDLEYAHPKHDSHGNMDPKGVGYKAKGIFNINTNEFYGVDMKKANSNCG